MRTEEGVAIIDLPYKQANKTGAALDKIAQAGTAGRIARYLQTMPTWGTDVQLLHHKCKSMSMAGNLDNRRSTLDKGQRGSRTGTSGFLNGMPNLQPMLSDQLEVATTLSYFAGDPP